MRRTSLVALALAAATLGFAGARSTGDPSYALLVAAMSAPSTVSYTGVVQAVRIGERSAEAAVYRVEHRAPSFTLRRYDAPAALLGESVISKGDLLYSIDPKHRRIVESRTDPGDDATEIAADYTLLHANYRAIEQGTETFDGRRAVDLALINKYSERRIMLLRIDTASKIVLDKQEFAPNGAVVSELRFEQIRYAAPMPPADFDLPKAYAVAQDPAFGEPPESPKRALGSAGFAAREPRSLPDGFVPVEGALVEPQGVRTVHLLYSDGVRTVSLFESVEASTLDAAQLQQRSIRIGDRSAEYTEDAGMALLAWSDGTLHYTLVAERGLVDLQRIAGSLSR
jgi:negative regulator of sigma E activity